MANTQIQKDRRNKMNTFMIGSLLKIIRLSLDQAAWVKLFKVRNRTLEDKIEFKKSKATINYQSLRAQQREHTMNKIKQADNTSKELWRTINQETSKSNIHGKISLQVKNNIIKLIVSNKLKDFFQQPIRGIDKPFFNTFQPITIHELETYFSKLKSNNTSGFDAITGKL